MLSQSVTTCLPCTAPMVTWLNEICALFISQHQNQFHRALPIHYVNHSIYDTPIQHSLEPPISCDSSLLVTSPASSKIMCLQEVNLSFERDRTLSTTRPKESNQTHHDTSRHIGAEERHHSLNVAIWNNGNATENSYMGLMDSKDRSNQYLRSADPTAYRFGTMQIPQHPILV